MPPRIPRSRKRSTHRVPLSAARRTALRPCPTTRPMPSGFAPWQPTCAPPPGSRRTRLSLIISELRADALLSDDYYASDIAWLDLKNPKIDLIFAPYETYLDDLLGVKTSYGGAILIRNQEQSRKLALYQENEAAMQQALPVPDADKPSKQGQSTPMEVVDAPLRAGDLRYGYQAVADNLPNDARIHAEKGTKKIFFKNFMDARVNAVILPIAAEDADSRAGQRCYRRRVS